MQSRKTGYEGTCCSREVGTTDMLPTFTTEAVF